MSDLDDLEEIAGGEWRPRRRQKIQFGQRPHGDHPTHCKRGHEFSPENTKINHNGWRTCRRCARLLQRARREGQRS